MSYSQSFPYPYNSNHEETDDSSSVFDADTVVFDADTVVSDEVPFSSPLPPLPSAITITSEYHQQHDNNEAISLSSSPSQSPPTTISQLLRRINSRRPMPSPSTTIASEEISANQSSSSSSKKDTVSDVSTEATFIDNHSSSSTTSKKLNKHEVRWKMKFQQLCAYKELHGNTNAPKSDKELGLWVQKQRHEYRKFKKNERMQMLLDSGLDFTRLPAEWNNIFSNKSDFKDFFGHTNVPKGYNQLSNLLVGSSQRKEYNNGMNAKIYSCMTPERIQMLESIDFVWSPPKGSQRNESVWDKRFAELCEYKELHGNTNPTLTTNQFLSRWVARQRKEYKAFQANEQPPPPITTRRIQLLNSIGFRWSFFT